MSNCLQIIDTLNSSDSWLDSSHLYPAINNFSSNTDTNLFADNTTKVGSLIKQNDSSTLVVNDSLNLNSSIRNSIPFQKSDTLLDTTTAIDTAETNIEIVERNVLSNDWLVGVLLFLLLSIGWIKMKYGKLLITMFKAAFNSRLANSLYNEEGSLQKKVSFFLNIIYILGIGLFITEIIQFYNIRVYGLSMFNIFWIVSLIYFLLLYFKATAYKLMAVLFNIRPEISEYLFTTLIFNKVLSFLILPLIIIIPFANDILAIAFIYIGIAIIIAFYLIQLLRGVQIIIKFKSSLIYSILYFFAFEIVPLLILFKFARSIL